MKKKFEDLLKKTKAHENGDSMASKTFEFDLFSEESWYLSMNSLDELSIETKPEIPSVNIKKTEIRVEEKTEAKSESSAIIHPDTRLKALFIGDTSGQNPDQASDEEDLLSKMIKAMKLSSTEFKRVPLDLELEKIENLEENLENPHPSFQNLLNTIESEAPQFVISLGATVTNLLLGTRSKMSGIHGKYFKLKANSWEYQLMPIFHPDFLLINPNMKRTAWIDLQKVMESLGKI